MTMQTDGSLTLTGINNDGNGRSRCIFIDKDSIYLYAGNSLGAPFHLRKVRISDFSDFATLVTNAIQFTGAVDPNSLFAYTNDGSDAVKINLTTFAKVTSFTPIGFDYLLCSGVDSSNTFLYYGNARSPARGIKINISTFSLNTSITFAAGETPCNCLGIDNTNSMVYFGLGTTPAKLIKVRVSDFTKVGSTLTFNVTENNAQVILMDVSAGFMYVGLLTSPAKIVKVRLSDFTEVDTLTFNTGENSIKCGIINTSTKFAWFGLYSASGTSIVKVNLSTFTEDSVLTFGTLLNGVTIDTVNGAGYFMSDTSPVIVYKIKDPDMIITQAQPSSQKKTVIVGNISKLGYAKKGAFVKKPSSKGASLT